MIGESRLEAQQRTHALGPAAGLASKSGMGSTPYGKNSPLTAVGSFNPEEQAKSFTLTLLKQAGEHFGLMLHPVDIRFDLKGKAAGMVRFFSPGPPVIRYNRALLEKYHHRFIKQTVPHEVAHVVVAALYPGKTAPHGPEWRLVMGYFGAEPTRCHDFQVDLLSVRRLSRFSYRCGCRKHRITAIRHNRIARGQRYYCRHCRGFLRPDISVE